jgi:hypothetical protein
MQNRLCSLRGGCYALMTVSALLLTLREGILPAYALMPVGCR